jgi:hypothetical protein
MQENTYINILSSNRIADLQMAFNKAYPFLKLEFAGAHPSKRYGRKKYLDSSLPLSAAGLTHPGTMLISDSMTVDQLENKLKSDFGLKVNAFRKSGGTWLEISMTGGWSLKQQNQHGKELSEPLKTEPFKDIEAPDNSLE